MSPTQRALKIIKDLRLPYEIVSYWNAHSKTRKDLLGIFDVLILVPKSHSIGLQLTTFSNRSSHITKMTNSRFIEPWLSMPGHQAHLWTWRETKKEQGFVYDIFSLNNGGITIETRSLPFDFMT